MNINIVAATRIDGWITESELCWLALQAHDCKDLIVEVGAYKGRSTRAMADNTTALVHTIDTWEGHDGIHSLPESGYEDFRKNLSDHLASRRVIATQRDSIEWIEMVRAIAAADMVFLDGDHSYDHLTKEITLFRQLVRPGGLLCGHDYWNASLPDVTRVVDGIFPGVQHYGSIWWVRV